MSLKSSTPLPHRDAPNPSQEQRPTSQLRGTRLISPFVLLGIGLIMLLAGMVLETVNIVSLGFVTVILAIGIISLSRQTI